MTDEKNHMERINEIIEEVGRSNAFSAEAMQQFVELQTECSSLESTNKYLRDKRTEAEEKLAKEKKSHEKTRNTVGDLNSQITAFHERNVELAAREAKITELELRSEYNQTRVTDHKEMVSLIFRNTVLKKTVATALPGLRADDGYGNRKEPIVELDTVEEREE